MSVSLSWFWTPTRAEGGEDAKDALFLYYFRKKAHQIVALLP